MALRAGSKPQARPFPDVRWAAIAILLLLSTAGCLGPPTVRVALLTESFAFDERAPAEAAEGLALAGCAGEYDPERRELTLVRIHDTAPTFVMLVHRAPTSRGPAGLADPSAGIYWPFTAGAGGGMFGIEPIERWMNERGASGGWGLDAPYHHEDDLRLSWGRRGITFDGEPVRDGGSVNRTLEHTVTQYNTTFTVSQTLSATYVGRVPYTLEASCDAR